MNEIKTKLKTMTDAIILWNESLFFEKMFQEYGISSMVSTPTAFNSPHLPPTKLLIVPSGFTFPEHAAVRNILEKPNIQKRIFDFVEKGGIFLMFSPVQEICTCHLNQSEIVFSFDRFGLEAEYVQTDVLIRRKSSLTGDQDSVYCDGRFQNIGKNFEIIESDENNQPIHILMKKGKGQIILSTVHEFLSKSYFYTLLNGPEVKI
jgi:hypothetical protein